VTRHLLVIGAQRCGTTYLDSMLDAHPQITMARPNRPEPKVFCNADLAARGHQWYLDTFFSHAHGETVLGDKSTSYLEDPSAPARAAEMLGEPHVLVVLRDPVQRAISNWRFSTDNGFETRDLDTALSENLAEERPWDSTRTSVSPYAYLQRGRYLDHLRPWAEAFPATTHVLFLTELLEDDSTIKGVYEELGLDSGAAPPQPLEALNTSNVEPPALDDGLMAELEAWFEDSNRALSDFLGRALPWWTPR
jgi:hypothetical protein